LSSLLRIFLILGAQDLPTARGHFVGSSFVGVILKRFYKKY